MIAHSFRGEAFGPAQRLHGATYVVDAGVAPRASSTPTAWWSTSRAPPRCCAAVLGELNLRNLDDDPAFAGHNTTTEFMARVIFDRIAARIAAGELGPHAGGLQALRVTLHESHVAWAAYEGALPVEPWLERPLQLSGAGRSGTRRTGGYIYDRRIVEGLRARQWTVEVQSPGEGFPAPDAAALRAGRGAWSRRCPMARSRVVDGLAFGVLPELAERHAQRLALGGAGAPSAGAGNRAGRGAGSRPCSTASGARWRMRGGVIVTSACDRACAGRTSTVPPARIAVVEPGTEPAPLAAGSGGDALALLCVATLTPRKGHALLLEALAGLQRPALGAALRRQPDAWMRAMRCGAAAGHRCAMAWRGRVRAARRAGRGGPATRCTRAPTLFVLPSFHEGYGMALAEALAHGLPVVSTTRRAPSPTPCRRMRACWCRRATSPALRAALQRVMDEPAWRAALAAGARAARQRLPSWPHGSARFASVAGRRAAARDLAHEQASAPTGWRCASPSIARRVPSRRDAGSDAAGWPRAAPRDAQPLGVLDLACGTGANLRALAPRLGGAQRWLLVDHDPALLAALPAALAAWAARAGLASRGRRRRPAHRRRPAWKSTSSGAALDLAQRAGCAALARTTQLVTASALLDLVSASWLDALVGALPTAGAAVLFALSVDGAHRMGAGRSDEDDAVHALFAAHQRRDKGFGPALGAEAPSGPRRCWPPRATASRQRASDWRIDASARARCCSAMIDGMADAPRWSRTPALRAARCANGRRRRLAHAAAQPPARRAPGLLALPARGAVELRAAQIQIPQHVRPHAEDAAGRPRAIAHRGAARQRQPGPAAADQHRRDAQVQPVQQPLRDEARDRDAAAFDEQHAQAALLQRGQQRAQVGRAVGIRIRPGTPSTCSAPTRRAASASRAASQTSSVGACRSRSTRSVGASRSAGSSSTRTGCSPVTRRVVSCGLSMAAVPAPTITASHSARSRCRCSSTCGAVHEVGIAAARGDAAVEALAELADHPGGAFGRAVEQGLEQREELEGFFVPCVLVEHEAMRRVTGEGLQCIGRRWRAHAPAMAHDGEAKGPQRFHAGPRAWGRGHEGAQVAGIHHLGL